MVRRSILLLMTLALAACGADAASETTTTVPATTTTTIVLTTTTTTTVPATTTTLPAALTEADTVTTAGLGPVKIGMTVEEATLAAGRAMEGPPAPDCYYVEPAGLDGVGFMITNERIARVDITAGPISTRSGARIGMTELEITTLFPGQIEEQPHKYVDGGHYLVFVPNDPADHRVIFETDGEVVTGYRAGILPEVEWVEGCS